MQKTGQLGKAVRFGVFELDFAARELRKSGLKVRLQEQPFRLLALLSERPGEVVSREELREKLWPSDTYVDFDRSLNTTASKLREALGDSATSPRFIETLPRRGYRFLASVEEVGKPELGSSEREGRSHSDRSAPQATDWTDPPQGFDRRYRQARTALVVSAALLVAAATVFLAGWTRSSPDTSPERALKFSIAPGLDLGQAAISPDGRWVVFVGGEERRTLWVQGLDEWGPREVEGTSGAEYPFWSPDSQWIGFFQRSGFQRGELKKVPAMGGSPIVLCRIPATFSMGGAWSPAGDTIVFSSGEVGLLHEVSALGGEPKPLFESSPMYGSRPYFLPTENGTQALVYSTKSRAASHIVLANLETGEREVLTRGTHPVYSATGHILYQPAPIISGVFALPFSLETLQPTGEAFPVAEEAWQPSVADDGTLMYRYSSAENVQLVWRGRDGELLGQVGRPQPTMRYPELSPDKRLVAVGALENENLDIWVHEVSRPVKARITRSSGVDTCPLWSSSGDKIAFSSTRSGNMDIFLRRTDGSGAAAPLIATEWKEFATDWSGDGKHILYDRSGEDGRNDIWYLERGDDNNFKPFPFLTNEFDERSAQLSPDGKYVAYVSDQSGPYEVYLSTFPKADRTWRASHDGGIQPGWSEDGTELYYVNNHTLYAVKMTYEPRLSPGSPEALFQAAGLSGSFRRRYDVSSDGQRFLMREPVSDSPSTIRVVQNWFAEFREGE